MERKGHGTLHHIEQNFVYIEQNIGMYTLYSYVLKWPKHVQNTETSANKVANWVPSASADRSRVVTFTLFLKPWFAAN